MHIARHPAYLGFIKRRDHIWVQKPSREIVKAAVRRFPGSGDLESRIGQKSVLLTGPDGKAAQESGVQRRRRDPSSRDHRRRGAGGQAGQRFVKM